MMSQTIPEFVTRQFDPVWYAQYYPDIQKAGVDPTKHFFQFGWNEGRWPFQTKALQQDNALWAARSPDTALDNLKSLHQSCDIIESALAAWFLCRWYASCDDWNSAVTYAEHMLSNSSVLLLLRHEGPFLLAFQCFFKTRQKELASALLAHSSWQASNNKLLAESMLVCGAQKLAKLNLMFSNASLETIVAGEQPSLSNLTAQSINRIPLGFFSPLVSVIVPCYNGEKTISVALDSLLTQSYKKIEIIVVDDASTDNSQTLLKSYQQKDSRVRYIRLQQNGGAYAARNLGLKVSRGKYITTHDADDWSHPQKIEMQVAALQKSKSIKACVSHWVRSDENLHFQRWRMEEGWIYRNVSSLMFRRSVHKALGYWDNVSVNADTEFYDRIIAKFGSSSIHEVMPGMPLAFGRFDPSSLTQTSATHLRTQFRGLRKDYKKAADNWHRQTRRLYLKLNAARPFFVPPHMCRGPVKERLTNLKHALQQQNLFDAQWYLRRYADVAQAAVDPLNHFIRFGIQEGRDPLPFFSLSGFACSNQMDNFNAMCLWASDESLRVELPYIAGDSASNEGDSILMVGHLCGEHLFGAERSFLDVIKMLSQHSVNITILLPEGKNSEYINTIRSYVSHIYFIPLPWWHASRAPEHKITECISTLIEKKRIETVYVNTLTLWEPLLAAKEVGIKSVVHVRELPPYDPDLCSLLGATSLEIRDFVISLPDTVIANSNTTAKYLNTSENVHVIGNVIDSELFVGENIRENSPLIASMISSNITKKGIADIFEVAQKCAKSRAEINFYIYGPKTPELSTLLENYAEKNVHFKGYTNDRINVLSKSDFVLSLSHFQESFGRSVLEGMASGCIVVAYDWGAVPEILSDNEGLLIEYKRPDIVAEKLIQLSRQPQVRALLSLNARKKAMENFSPKAVSRQLAKAIFNRDNAEK